MSLLKNVSHLDKIRDQFLVFLPVLAILAQFCYHFVIEAYADV
jgi:hypothetical protein